MSDTAPVTVGTALTFTDYRDVVREGTVIELVTADFAVIEETGTGDRYNLDLGEDDYTVHAAPAAPAVPASVAALEDLFGPVIYSYTRAQAIKDGELTDLSALATEYGFTIPVAITREAHADFIAWDERTEARKSDSTGQDETGRAWDVLTMLKHAISRNPKAGEGDRLPFDVYRIQPQGRGTAARRARLTAVLSGDDTGAPCLTVMMPHES